MVLSCQVYNCFWTSSGSSGQSIELTANFFRILSRPQWVLYQYHVDYKPAMEARSLRSALLFQHSEVLGSARCFDGALLFLPHKLHDKVLWRLSCLEKHAKLRCTTDHKWKRETNQKKQAVQPEHAAECSPFSLHEADRCPVRGSKFSPSTPKMMVPEMGDSTHMWWSIKTWSTHTNGLIQTHNSSLLTWFILNLITIHLLCFGLK